MAPKEVICCMDDEIKWIEDEDSKMSKEEYRQFVELFRKAQQEEPYSERGEPRSYIGRYFE